MTDFQFFLQNGLSYVVGEHAKGALALARAERWGRQQGIEPRWEYEDYPDDSFVDDWPAHAKKAWRATEHTCYVLTVGREVLGGIFDPTPTERRVYEAELYLALWDSQKPAGPEIW